MYDFKEKLWLLYPAECFNNFQCIKTWELATIIAESNSWKTTFALDMISRNAKRWVKWYYINLEFPIETMRESRWLRLHNKSKMNLTNLDPLSEEEIKDLERYVNEQLGRFEYYNNPSWIDLDMLLKVIELQALAWYKFFVIDTFSRIHWNTNENARWNQNKCMEELQELAQRLNVAIIMLHHTNRQWAWEWSQKIMDLSNVFMVITKQVDAEWEEYRNYALMKDKYVVSQDVDVYYHWWKYEKF